MWFSLSTSDEDWVSLTYCLEGRYEMRGAISKLSSIQVSPDIVCRRRPIYVST